MHYREIIYNIYRKRDIGCIFDAYKMVCYFIIEYMQTISNAKNKKRNFSTKKEKSFASTHVYV